MNITDMWGVLQPNSSPCELPDENGLRRIMRLYKCLLGNTVLTLKRAGDRTKEGQDIEQCMEKHSFKVKSKCSRPATSCLGRAMQQFNILAILGRELKYNVHDNAERDSCVISTNVVNHNIKKAVLAYCKGKHRWRGQWNFYPAATDAFEYTFGPHVNTMTLTIIKRNLSASFFNDHNHILLLTSWLQWVYSGHHHPSTFREHYHGHSAAFTVNEWRCENKSDIHINKAAGSRRDFPHTTVLCA